MNYTLKMILSLIESKYAAEILTPSPNGENCLYNGTNEEYECACEECDYFLECFGG